MTSGILVIDKEGGYTSFDVVAKIRRILHIRKVGHTGTLDPDATGVLPVCVGKATKVVSLLSEKDKVYDAVMRLGMTTDTEDISGTVLTQNDAVVSEEEIRSAVSRFVGEILQVPPMYSAIRVDGKRLYELARQGRMVERKPRLVQIHSIYILDISFPFVRIEVHCGSGTYIRSLCRDVGEALSVGACLYSLRRTYAAGFSIKQAKQLSEVEAFVAQDRLREVLLPVDTVFQELPRAVCLPFVEKAVRNGINVPNGNCRYVDTTPLAVLGSLVRLYLPDGTFAGIYKAKRDGLALQKLFLE